MFPSSAKGSAEKPVFQGIELLESRLCLSASDAINPAALAAAGFFLGGTSPISTPLQIVTRPSGSSNTSGGVTRTPVIRRAATTADTQFVQTHYASDHLETALFEIGAVAATRADVRAFSRQAALDHITSARQDERVARSIGVTLDTRVTSATDLALIQSVASHVGAADFDTFFLTTMAQLHATDAQQTQTQVPTLTNRQVRKLAVSALNLDNKHLSALNALLGI